MSLVSASTITAAQKVGRGFVASLNRPDAVFCANNFTTLGLMQAVTEAGLDCPEDIAVVGFDDFPWSTAFRPRLTAVAQPSYPMGVESVGILFDRILRRRQGAPIRLTLKASLVIRDSCGATVRRNGGLSGNA